MNYFPFNAEFNQHYQQNLFNPYELQYIDYNFPSQQLAYYQAYQNLFSYNQIENLQINNQMTFNLTSEAFFSPQNIYLEQRNLLSKKNNQEAIQNQDQDQDTPYKKINNKQVRQKQGRNMLSNLFRQGMKIYMHDKYKTIQLVSKISDKYKINVDAALFVDQLERKLKNLRSYIRIGQIQSFINGNDKLQTQSNSKILRILLYKFLREQIIPSLFNNAKVQKSNRIVHLRQVKRFTWLISTL